jgi:non-specific protein-tyrosine kinase
VQDSASAFQPIDRQRVFQAVRRWARIVLAAMAAGALLAFVVSRLIPPEYEATAQLYLAPASNPTVALQDVSTGQTLATSYVELARSDVILKAALERTRWPEDLRSFRDRVRVAQLRNTSIITVTFRSGDPQRSAEVANAIADIFITQTKALQTSLQGTTASELDKQIASVQSDIDALDKEVGILRQALASPSPRQSAGDLASLQAQLQQLDASRQSKQETLASLVKTRDDMRLAQARAETTVSLWQSAAPPEEPSAPRPLLNTLLGALGGGLLAVFGIALFTYFDDRLVDTEDVRERLRAAPLGQVRLHEHPETIAGKLFVREEPTSPEAEAIRGIRTNIVFAGGDRRPRTLLITSAVAGEGKSVLSANLALAFAEAGTPVVLVDADLRRPSQHRLFGLNPTPGLTNVLAETATLADVQKSRVNEQLLVIPSGPLPPNPAELLGSARMLSFITKLAAVSEQGVVILDSSPVLAVADPVSLSTEVDGTIVVVDSSRTHVAPVRHALRALEQVRAQLIGVVLNKIPEHEASYYRYGGYYPRVTERPNPQTHHS